MPGVKSSSGPETELFVVTTVPTWLQCWAVPRAVRAAGEPCFPGPPSGQPPLVTDAHSRTPTVHRGSPVILLNLMWTPLAPSFQARAELCTSSQAACQTSVFDRRVLISQLPFVPVCILRPFPSPLGYGWLCWWGLQLLQGWGGPFPPSFQLRCTLAGTCVLQGGSPHQVFKQEEELAFNWEA